MTFNTVHREPPVVRPINGDPVTVEDLACFVYPAIDVPGWWHVCELASGRSIGNARTRQQAIDAAAECVRDRGLSKLRAMAAEHDRINA